MKGEHKALWSLLVYTWWLSLQPQCELLDEEGDKGYCIGGHTTSDIHMDGAGSELWHCCQCLLLFTAQAVVCV